MKALSCTLLLMSGLAFAVLGCTDNSVPIDTPTSVGDNTAASLMKTSGPGAWIVKSGLVYAFFFYDANSGLMLCLGINDLAAACTGQPGAIDEFDRKQIYLPGEDPDRRMILHMTGDDVGAIVWSGPVSPCANAPLAVGTAHVERTDNDFYATLQDNNNSNAYGFKANGTLVGPDGQVYKLNFVFRGVWDGEDPASRKEVLKIQLTPTGKE